LGHLGEKNWFRTGLNQELLIDGLPECRKLCETYHYTKQAYRFVKVYAWYPDWEFLFQTGIILFNPHT
jgi:hypothetical protein